MGGIWNAGGTARMDSSTFTSLATGNVGSGGSGGFASTGGASGSSGLATSTIATTGGGDTNTNYNPNATPTTANLSGDSVSWAGEGSTVSLDAGGNASLSDAELEALNSAEVLDFNLYLSPFDVWTAAVRLTRAFLENGPVNAPRLPSHRLMLCGCDLSAGLPSRRSPPPWSAASAGPNAG